MHNHFSFEASPALRPAREQNLFISLSKHLYLLKDGSLKHQDKKLDPRTAGDREMLLRLVVLDVDTGTLYGELHSTRDEKDLAGFLARAWCRKADHPMRGVPETLNVPKAALKDDAYANDLYRISALGGVRLGELPGGFAAGIHALQQFDREVRSLFWQMRRGERPNLKIVQMCSSVISAGASSSMGSLWKERWGVVEPPADEFFAEIDHLYKEPGAWRKSPFDIAIDGLGRKEK